jgi:hypothetical protein
MSKSYLINLEDGEDGEVILPFPAEMLTELGWNEGDTLDWTDNKDGTFSIKKIEPAMQWVLVETVSMFRERYMVEVPVGTDQYGKNKVEWALDTVVMEDAKEFSQQHLGQTIVSHRVVSEEEALKMCDVDNDYASEWSDKKKIEVFFTEIKDEVEHFPIPN